MALDQSALLAVMEALRTGDPGQMVRTLLQTALQWLIDVTFGPPAS